MQGKPKAVNANFREELKGAGRNSARKFWQHVGNKQEGPSSTKASVRDPQRGEDYEGQDCLEYGETCMALKR